METARTTASGAQAETYRWTSPVVVKMLMKMSLAPRTTARSRSWCTSWKSRVASAEAITNVGVTSITRSGSAPLAGRQAGSAMSPARVNVTRTGSPIRTWSGRTPGISPSIRTPSGSCTSATTIGSRLPGTGGWWCTT